jgi:hypothetical protein
LADGTGTDHGEYICSHSRDPSQEFWIENG